MSEERIEEALRALRKADLDVETGGEAEIRALLAFRRQQRAQRRRRSGIRLMWAAAVAAALTIAVMNRPIHQATPPAETAVAGVDQTAPNPPAVLSQPAPDAAKPGPREIATDFFPLMPSLPPSDRGLLVRMTVPASTMRAVGLPVGDDHLSDPVQADVLVGQDDLPRAIRFVSYRK